MVEAFGKVVSMHPLDSLSRVAINETQSPDIESLPEWSGFNRREVEVEVEAALLHRRRG